MCPRAAESPRVVRVLGTDVAVTTYDDALQRILDAAREGRGLGVSPVAVHAVMEAHDDGELAQVYRSIDLVPPDGHGVRMAANYLAGEDVLGDRVYGPDLMGRICGALAATRGSVFLYGADCDTLDTLAGRLTADHPGLRIAGVRASRFRPSTVAELDADVEQIRSSGADVVLVGLGTPRQDLFIFQTVRSIERPMLGCGVGFAYHAGLKKEAPAWVKDRGLQWLHRLFQEPRRLWHRYLVLNPRFALLVLRQRLAQRRDGAT